MNNDGTITAEEYCTQTGGNLQELQDAIYEAEHDLITRDTIDFSTVRFIGDKQRVLEKMRNFMEAAGYKTSH